MTAYNFGPGHPMAPERMDLTARLARSLGLFDLDHVKVAAPEVASDAELESVHAPDYVAAVRRVSADPSQPDESRGLGTEDDPAFAGMHEASARLAGGSLLAAERVLDGSALHAVNFGGGMHHAARDRASGFCIYNDAALAVQKLLDGGVRKVAYIDVDAHHGDGTQNIFWDDPRVLTLSLHETGLTLFPGTGFANEIGGPAAEGTAVNVALPAGTADAGWLRAFYAVVSGTLKQPEALIDMPVERNPKAPATFRVGRGGKSALTHYTVVEEGRGRSLLKLQPETGRTHQLRVHLNHIGHPIVGDFMYGGEQAQRMMLHAASLELTLPNRERKVFSAPVPKSFQEAVRD